MTQSENGTHDIMDIHANRPKHTSLNHFGYETCTSFL